MARYPKNSSPKLTKELINQIASVIKGGNYVETAIASCGISKDTFYRWINLAQSEDGTSLHRLLSDEVALAFAEASVRDLEVIDRAAMGTPDKFALNDDGSPVLDSNGRPIIIEKGIKPDWRAAVWRLERRLPNQWGKNSKGVDAQSVVPEVPSAKEQERLDKESKATIKRYLEILEATGGVD